MRKVDQEEQAALMVWFCLLIIALVVWFFTAN